MAIIRGSTSIQSSIDITLNPFPQASLGTSKFFLIPGYKIGGDAVPNATNPTTHLDVSSGYYASDDSEVMIKCEAWTLDCSTSWASGNNSGKLVDVSALVANTTYHVFVISNAGGSVTDYCVSPLLSPTLPSGFVHKRRITSRKTDGTGNLIEVIQRGNWHLYKKVQVPLDGVDISASGALYSLGVPEGIRVLVDLVLSPGGPGSFGAPLTISMQDAQQDGQTPVWAPAESAFRGMVTAFKYTHSSETWMYATTARALLYTDDSARVRMRRSPGSSYTSVTTRTTVQVFGWFDAREVSI